MAALDETIEHHGGAPTPSARRAGSGDDTEPDPEPETAKGTFAELGDYLEDDEVREADGRKVPTAPAPSVPSGAWKTGEVMAAFRQATRGRGAMNGKPIRQSLRARAASSDDDRGRCERRLERLTVDLGKVARKIARLIAVLEAAEERPDALQVRCRVLASAWRKQSTDGRRPAGGARRVPPTPMETEGEGQRKRSEE